jgi:hypothetical protein
MEQRGSITDSTVGGQPECVNSETCLFTSAFSLFYEGCGQTSIPYNWITECWNYPQFGTPPVSQIYCPESAPSCGYYAFIFGPGNTYYNFGCSITSYGSLAFLVSTTDNGSAASTTFELAEGGTNSITEVPATVTVTTEATPTNYLSVLGFGPGSNQTTTTESSSSQSSNGSQPIINSHRTSKSTPIGAIVGGVVGGIALIALVAFVAWFLLRKHRQDKAAAQSNEAQAQQQQADAATAAAFHNHQRISEIGEAAKPAATYIPPDVYANAGNQKPAATANSQEVYRPQPSAYGMYGSENTGHQSPPPMYAHPPPNSHSPASPHSGYTELDVQGRPTSAPPVSPTATYPSVNELGGENRGSYQMPPNVQEMSASTGGLGRRPVGGPRPQAAQPQLDMSGNPMSENWNHHELE